jgi:hypothetical protein
LPQGYPPFGLSNTSSVPFIHPFRPTLFQRPCNGTIILITVTDHLLYFALDFSFNTWLHSVHCTGQALTYHRLGPHSHACGPSPDVRRSLAAAHRLWSTETSIVIQYFWKLNCIRALWNTVQCSHENGLHPRPASCQAGS